MVNPFYICRSLYNGIHSVYIIRNSKKIYVDYVLYKVGSLHNQIYHKNKKYDVNEKVKLHNCLHNYNVITNLINTVISFSVLNSWRFQSRILVLPIHITNIMFIRYSYLNKSLSIPRGGRGFELLVI